MFNTKKITGFIAATMCSAVLALNAPFNVFADGNILDVYGDGSNLAPAIQWTWLDDNVSSGECADGSAAMADCIGTLFCNDENPYTSYDCYVNDGTCTDLNGDGIITDWLGDGYCDDGSFGVNFQCDEYGWDCGDCGDEIVDPNDYCNEAPPVSCEDQGLITCPDGSCADSFDDCPESLLDCQGNPFTEEYLSWIGDGYCDGVDMAYGLDFACAEYDCDGCDCVGDAAGQSDECLATCGGEMAVNPGTPKEYYGTSYSPERIRPSFDVRTGEYNPGNMVNNSRLISWVLTITINDGAYAGQSFDFETSQTEINIFGFAEGDGACGTVITVDGAESSPPSCEACGLGGIPNDGEPCDPGEGGGGGDECADYDIAGDVNDDDSVNVLDIVSVVNHILGDELEGCPLGAADMNADAEINVLDIVSIVNVILGGRSADATSATMSIDHDTVSISGNGFIGAVQMTLSHDAGFSIDLTDDAMVAEYRTNGNMTTLIVVAPNSDEIFTATGDFKIEETIVASGNGYVPTSTPASFTLSAAYPNPFNPSTSLDLNIPSEGYVSVVAYNLVGQVVGTIAEGNMNSGTHSFVWDASDLSSGVYLIKAEYAGNVATQKVMLMK